MHTTCWCTLSRKSHYESSNDFSRDFSCFTVTIDGLLSSFSSHAKGCAQIRRLSENKKNVKVHLIYILNITSTPLQHHINTTSTPHQHHINTTSTPHQHHINTTSTPHQHHINITSTPHQHHINTTSTPHQHHINYKPTTTTTLNQHHLNTTPIQSQHLCELKVKQPSQQEKRLN